MLEDDDYHRLIGNLALHWCETVLLHFANDLAYEDFYRYYSIIEVLLIITSVLLFVNMILPSFFV